MGMAFMGQGKVLILALWRSLSNWRKPRQVAERGGFEPPIRFHVCLISSQVHSTSSATSPRSWIIADSYI